MYCIVTNENEFQLRVCVEAKQVKGCWFLEWGDGEGVYCNK